MPKQKTLIDCLQDKNIECEKLKDALRNIYANIVHNEPSVQQGGIITNIKMALSEEEFKRWEEIYK